MSLHTSRSPGCAGGPPLDVGAWRRCRLLEAGFPPALAAAVAADHALDLHELLGLVDRGCRPGLAVRIVAPVDHEVAP